MTTAAKPGSSTSAAPAPTPRAPGEGMDEPLPEPQHLATVDLVAGLKRIKAEVAKTDAERQRGLMSRRDVAGDQGMLFVFPKVAFRSFWMKNTPSPLTIAFIADDGRIVQIDDLEPFDLGLTRSVEPVRYALEMPRGWFVAAGIKAGDKIFGLERAGQARD